MNTGSKVAIVAGIVLAVIFSVVLLNQVNTTSEKMTGNYDEDNEETTTKTTTTYKYTAKVTVD